MIVGKCRYSEPAHIPDDFLNNILLSFSGSDSAICYILFDDLPEEEKTFLILTTKIFQFVTTEEYIEEVGNFGDSLDEALKYSWPRQRLKKVKEYMGLK